jgi:hypothetical protein
VQLLTQEWRRARTEDTEDTEGEESLKLAWNWPRHEVRGLQSRSTAKQRTFRHKASSNSDRKSSVTSVSSVRASVSSLSPAA